MDVLKLISLSFFEGCYDSIRNIFVVFYLDKEMNKKYASKTDKILSSQPSNTEKAKKSNKEKKKRVNKVQR